MDEGGVQRYVKAKAISQVRPSRPNHQPADVWLGGMSEQDPDGNVFVTLEVKPAWGPLAQIRLSPDELRELGDMIANRLGEDATRPVEIIIPAGVAARITQLGEGGTVTDGLAGG